MINDIDINKIIVSNKNPFGKQDFKYFIGYKDSEKNRPLCIFRLQMIIYKKHFDENRPIYFLIKKEKVFIKVAADMRYFARSNLSRSSVHKKTFRLIWQVVFKLGYLFCQ